MNREPIGNSEVLSLPGKWGQAKVGVCGAPLSTASLYMLAGARLFADDTATEICEL